MRDLVCEKDLDLFGRETDDPLEILSQDLYHRLIELYGSNPDDTDRGVGIVSMLSGAIEDVDPSAVIEADFRKDDRVVSASAKVDPIPEVPGGYRIQIEVEAEEAIYLEVEVRNGQIVLVS